MSRKKNVGDLKLDLFFNLSRHAYFGAGDSASFWKRGSFRSGSNIGSSRSSAGVSGTPAASAPSYGIESSFCKAATARSGSPSCVATRARTSIEPGPENASFSIGSALPLLNESERRGLITKAHIGQREISEETNIFRLVFEKRLQFAARLSPTFLGGSMITGNFLRPA